MTRDTPSAAQEVALACVSFFKEESLSLRSHLCTIPNGLKLFYIAESIYVASESTQMAC